MKRSFYARYGWLLLGLAALAIPPMLWGVRETFRGANNNVSQWLPEDFPETETYQRFREQFGADAFALVSWDGCTLEDPRLEQFALHVVPPPGRAEADGHSKWFLEVTTGPRALRTLLSEPFRLSRDEAIRRLTGTLIGPDGRTTCALVILSPKGDSNRTAALAALEKIVVEDCGVAREKLHLAGDSVANAAIDLESERAVRQWLVLSWVVALTVAWFCLRSLRSIFEVFVTAVFASGVATAAIHFTGGSMNLVLVVVPVLIYVLTLSAAVHLTNYYRDAVREQGVEGAPQRALAVGWVPCSLSAATTALGLISLCVSHILPVKLFGIHSAVGIVLSVAVVFLLLPTMMALWPFASRRSDPARLKRGGGDRLLRSTARWIVRRRRPVMGACLLLLAVAAVGVARVDTILTPLRYFSPHSRWVEDSVWFQEHVGPMVPFEVVLSFSPENKLTFLDRMILVWAVQQEIENLQIDGRKAVGGTISAATFGPAMKQLKQERPRIGSMGRIFLKTMGVRDPAEIERRELNRRLLEHRHRLEETGYLKVLGEPDDPQRSTGQTEPVQPRERELWRISARVPALANLQHDQFLQGVEERVDAFLARHLTDPGTVEPSYTGIVPLVYVAQRELLTSLFTSFCLAFVLIAVVLTVVLRNVYAGLLVMLPSVFPAVITFGFMGLSNLLVDIGAMMTASVALGIAVDDTLHYLTWFRRGLRRGLPRSDAIVEAYLRCAAAMTHTTMIAGLGLLVFMFSSFQPISQFGLLMFILLIAALIGDLVLLPAMLATRLGRVFEPRRE